MADGALQRHVGQQRHTYEGIGSTAIDPWTVGRVFRRPIGANHRNTRSHREEAHRYRGRAHERRWSDRRREATPHAASDPHDLDLPATIHHERAENLSLAVDIVTARACAPLHRLLGYARPYLQAGAQGLFLKGQDVVADMTEAARYWEYEADVVPSLSDAGGRIVRVKRLGRARKV